MEINSLSFIVRVNCFNRKVDWVTKWSFSVQSDKINMLVFSLWLLNIHVLCNNGFCHRINAMNTYQNVDKFRTLLRVQTRRRTTNRYNNRVLRQSCRAPLAMTKLYNSAPCRQLGKVKIPKLNSILVSIFMIVCVCTIDRNLKDFNVASIVVWSLKAYILNWLLMGNWYVSILRLGNYCPVIEIHQ